MEGSITRDTPTKEEQSGDILIRSSRSPSRLALMNKTRLRDIRYIYIYPFFESPMEERKLLYLHVE